MYTGDDGGEFQLVQSRTVRARCCQALRSIIQRTAGLKKRIVSHIR